MKLKNPEDNRSVARDRRDMPAGPARLARLLKLLENDLSGLPLDANPPPEVTAAHQAFTGAVAWAKQTAGQVDEAEEAAAEAAEADVAAAVKVAEAGGAGKLPEPTRSRKAAGAVEAALLGCEAAEKHVGEAHGLLVDAVQEAWPSWRVQIVRDAAAARVKAAEATKAAAAAVATARGLFAAVTTLDGEVLARDGKLLQAVSKEMREGLPWLESTHTGLGPLRHVSIHGVERDGKPMALDLAVVVEAVAAAAAEAGTFPASDWVPPGDERHSDLLAEPLDPDEPWVKARIRREWGDVCVICRLPGTDVAVEVVGATWPWAMAHRTCRDKAPDAKAKQHAERVAKMQASGFPPSPNEASQLVPDGGRVQKDDGFSG